MYRAAALLAVCLFLFILWVIYLANTGADSVFFRFVRTIPNGDKVGHACLYGLLSLISVIAFKFRAITFGGVGVYYGAALVLGFVIVEETSQMFIATRTFDLVDMAANLVGILSGVLVCILGRYLHRQLR